MTAVFAIVFVLAIAVVATVYVVKNLIYICQPNEVLVFSGPRRQEGARTVGYRLIQGGRGVRIPLLERVSKLDLTNMIIDLRVDSAYSKGGIPLHVSGVANVKVASDEPFIGNAIERFLGKSRLEIVQVAKETLEGNLRGVLATLTPEEVNDDRVKFAESLLHEADHDLKRLGLSLDTLKIQNVSDDRGYLDSIGRKQSAELQMRSRVAEADNQAQSRERSAKNLEEKELTRIRTEIEMAKAEAARRIVDAQTRREAMIAEQRAEVTALTARAEAQIDVQTARLEQMRRQLLADRIRPAEARREQMIAEARGEAATIIEDGRATATSLREVARTWHASNGEAGRIYVAQRMGEMVKQLLSTVDNVVIDRVSVVDRSLAQGAGLASQATLASEHLKTTLGIDVPRLLGAVMPRETVDVPVE